MIGELIDRYHGLTDWLLAATGASDKTMHVHVGLFLYVAAQLALRTRRGSIDALIVVFAAEAANEAMDRLFFGSWRWADTLGDLAATLFWPAALTAMSRYRRRRWARRRADATIAGSACAQPFRPFMPRR